MSTSLFLLSQPSLNLTWRLLTPFQTAGISISDLHNQCWTDNTLLLYSSSSTSSFILYTSLHILLLYSIRFSIFFSLFYMLLYIVFFHILLFVLHIPLYSSLYILLLCSSLYSIYFTIFFSLFNILLYTGGAYSDVNNILASGAGGPDFTPRIPRKLD